jgi:pimeloyl-ACP methyl ester carboxylesterase
MSRKSHFFASDLHGIARLAADAATAWVPSPFARFAQDVVYAAISCGHSLAEFVIHGIAVPYGPYHSSYERESAIAALNGILGDHLAESANPLAIPMRLRRDGKSMAMEKKDVAATLPRATGTVLLMIHGLCRNDLQWRRRGHDHGAALEARLGHTAVYVHYNSGRHISTNGKELDELIERLVHAWPVPVERIIIVGHSMGGLVARSACHYAKASSRRWTGLLEKMVFLGSPHHGAPLERIGHWLHATLDRYPYTAPIAKLGRMRSAGITDLRFGNLVDEDWEGLDRFVHGVDSRRRIPLPRGVKCYAMAATTGRDAEDVRARLLGDGLVTVGSALGLHEDPARTLSISPQRQWVAYETGHLDLLSRPAVYEKLVEWLE